MLMSFWICVCYYRVGIDVLHTGITSWAQHTACQVLFLLRVCCTQKNTAAGSRAAVFINIQATVWRFTLTQNSTASGLAHSCQDNRRKSKRVRSDFCHELFWGRNKLIITTARKKRIEIPLDKQKEWQIAKDCTISFMQVRLGAFVLSLFISVTVTDSNFAVVCRNIDKAGQQRSTALSVWKSLFCTCYFVSTTGITHTLDTTNVMNNIALISRHHKS